MSMNSAGDKTMDIQTATVTVDGNEYVLTLGTGEVSYGSDGGTCAFAYDASEYREVASRANSYQDLCDELDPVGDFEELRRIAVYAAARHECRVTIAGACNPVLSDDEYALVRETVAALAS